MPGRREGEWGKWWRKGEGVKTCEEVVHVGRRECKHTAGVAAVRPLKLQQQKQHVSITFLSSSSRAEQSLRRSCLCGMEQTTVTSSPPHLHADTSRHGNNGTYVVTTWSSDWSEHKSDRCHLLHRQLLNSGFYHLVFALWLLALPYGEEAFCSM